MKDLRKKETRKSLKKTPGAPARPLPTLPQRNNGSAALSPYSPNNPPPRPTSPHPRRKELDQNSPRSELNLPPSKPLPPSPRSRRLETFPCGSAREHVLKCLLEKRFTKRCFQGFLSVKKLNSSGCNFNTVSFPLQPCTSSSTSFAAISSPSRFPCGECHTKATSQTPRNRHIPVSSHKDGSSEPRFDACTTLKDCC